MRDANAIAEPVAEAATVLAHRIVTDLTLALDDQRLFKVAIDGTGRYLKVVLTDDGKANLTKAVSDLATGSLHSIYWTGSADAHRESVAHYLAPAGASREAVPHIS